MNVGNKMGPQIIIVILHQPIISFWPNNSLYEEELEKENMREFS